MEEEEATFLDVLDDSNENFDTFSINSKDKHKKRRRSKLWEDFDELPNKSSRCKLCGKIYTNSGHSTLKRHMEKKHSKLYIPGIELPVIKLPFRQRLVQWVISCQLPFTIVESEKFKQLFDNNEQIPSADTIKNDIIRLYANQKDLLINQFKSIKLVLL